MKFHEYESLYSADKSILKHKISATEWYTEQLAAWDIYDKIPNGKWAYKQILAESDWLNLNKPFYNMWPCIVDGLSKVKLDLHCKDIVNPLLKLPQALILKFAENGDFNVEGNKLRTILANRIITGGLPGVQLFCDFSERLLDQAIFWNISFALENCTVEQSIESLTNNLTKREENAIKMAVRLLLGVSMLADDAEIVESVILTKDKGKPITPNLIEKAKKRGVVGWNIGKNIQHEISPHQRRAHFAIRWMGKGGKNPVLRRIKGSIVKRHKLTEVPTGYEENE